MYLRGLLHEFLWKKTPEQLSFDDHHSDVPTFVCNQTVIDSPVTYGGVPGYNHPAIPGS
jgi:hypothetical protein